jgi:hypothetical protein
MLDEPVSKHRAVDNLNQFIIQNHLIVAHIAGLRMLVIHNAEDRSYITLDTAINRIRNACEKSKGSVDSDHLKNPHLIFSTEALTASKVNYPSWFRIQQRIELLHQDIEKIIASNLAIRGCLLKEDATQKSGV